MGDLTLNCMTCLNDSNFEASFSAAKIIINGNYHSGRIKLRAKQYLALHGIIMSLGFVVITRSDEFCSNRFI